MRIQTWPPLLRSCLFAASVFALTGVAGAMIPAPLPAEAAVTPPSVAVASMTTARAGHTATYLNSGLVLVTGGRGSAGYLRSAELYDRNFNTWMAAASMAVPRIGHSATLLRDGQVLVVGVAGAQWSLRPSPNPNSASSCRTRDRTSSRSSGYRC